ncbi:MAG: N-acetylmuramoyl-L-alanine amidase, partial [Deltaproteobacteria bacterium]
LRLILLFVTILLIVVSAGKTPSSTLTEEQRERVKEIEKEIERLKLGKKTHPRAYVKGIRYYTSGEYARVVLDVTRLSEYRVKEDGAGVRVILPSARSLLRGKDATIREKKGFLREVRALSSGESLEVRIALASRGRVKSFTLPDPPRIVLDFYPVEEKGKGREGVVTRRKFDKNPGKVVVVLDPGHGGRDPGAVGRYGTKEKWVTLKIARKLKGLLQKDGRFSVVLTRERDVYLSLEKRAAIANAAKADMFISIHTNASRRRWARGVSTYLLGRKATDRDALELAMRENGEMAKEGGISTILLDLLNYGKERESLRLAKSINDSLYGAVKRRSRRTRNLGVKRAPFYVLFGSSMPAVLVEVCFITNPTEEKLLRRDSFITSVARAIYGGIVEYVEKTRTALYEAGR